MYAVMGITGNVGGAVARTLLAKGEKVRGIVRNPEKATEWQKQGAELFKAWMGLRPRSPVWPACS
jgi:NAD(P)H dehydrogenase (quinone)